jgi:hypothetical protein
VDASIVVPVNARGDIGHARTLLGDLLLRSGRPGEALTALTAVDDAALTDDGLLDWLLGLRARAAAALNRRDLLEAVIDRSAGSAAVPGERGGALRPAESRGRPIRAWWRKRSPAVPISPISTRAMAARIFGSSPIARHSSGFSRSAWSGAWRTARALCASRP